MKSKRPALSLIPIILCLIFISSLTSSGAENANKEEWISLFNGKNLDGWTPKFRGQKLGVNYKNTFRVEDGILKVCYDEYEKFDSEYGHLFFKEKFSHYKIRVVYRFVGEQVPNGPGWALRNNGVMLHCQAPETMSVEQDFPCSIEGQILGGNGKDKRTTGNLCTPGTNVVMDGKLITGHCTNSNSKTFHGDQWVTSEFEVHGSGIIKHIINGEIVMQYEQPQLDPKDQYAKVLLEAGAPTLIEEGYISVQAESHPTEFQKIEILLLEK